MAFMPMPPIMSLISMLQLCSRLVSRSRGDVGVDAFADPRVACSDAPGAFACVAALANCAADGDQRCGADVDCVCTQCDGFEHV